MQQAAAIPLGRWPLALVVLALVAAGGWWGWSAIQARGPAGTEIHGTIETVEIDVNAPRAGRLVNYQVEEGAALKAGQVIALLAAPDVDEQYERAKSLKSQADARLKELRELALPAEAEAAEGELRAARANEAGARRAAELAQQALATRTALKSALDQARAQRQVAQRALDQVEAGIRGASEAKAAAERELATSLQLKQARDAAIAQEKALEEAFHAAEAKERQLSEPRDEEKSAAAAMVDQAQAALEEANDALGFAREQYDDLRALADRGAIARSKVREAQARVDTAQSRVKQAIQAKEQASARLRALERGPTPAEREAVAAAVRQAREAWQGAAKARETAVSAWELKLAANAQVAAAKAQLELAEAQKKSARATLDGAVNAVRNATQAYSAALAEQQGANATAQQAGAAAGLAAAAAAKASAKRKAAGEHSPQLRQAQIARDQAEAAFKLAETMKRELTVVAPQAGRLERRMVDPGELVSQGATIARIVPVDSLTVIAYITADQRRLFPVRQEVTVSAGGASSRGRVLQIGQTPEFTPGTLQTEAERAQEVYQIRVEVLEPGSDMTPGMPATVRSGGRR